MRSFRNGYTQISNDILRDEKNLSLSAIGLYVRMMSLPKDWNYSISGLAAISGCGKDRIRSALKELEDAGYVAVVKSRINGKFRSGYQLFHSPTYPQGNDKSVDKSVDKSKIGV